MPRLSLPRAIGLAAILLLLLAGCQPRPAPGPESTVPTPAQPWPPYDYAAVAASDLPVFRLDPERTQIDVVVRRDGPLARFGHDHVVTLRELEGFLLLTDPPGASRADLRFAVAKLAVDAADARQRHGLDDGPDAADIEGTRDNLMQYVLDPGQWPWATVALRDFRRQGEHVSAQVDIEINGQRHASRQPFTLQREQGVVTVEGFMVLRQTDLGLQPFSALGGGLRVADPMEVHFYLSGSRR